MARHDSPADSPLSSMTDTSDVSDDDSHDIESLPPAKRQKLGGASTPSSAAVMPEPEHVLALDGCSDISSDTSGEIPSSPTGTRFEDDDFQEQVTSCAWEGCESGDYGNMDKLVEHIHNDHIEIKQKKYTCEWVGCQRKSMPHASGYALKAHMRSHTREKPFYCYLPECDRAFTRSDALAKHMRTVHETEALRPSDPVPKSMQASSAKTGRPMRIILRTVQSHTAGHEDILDEGSAGGDEEHGAGHGTVLSEEYGFSREELRLAVPRLFGLCRMQLKWAETEGELLQQDIREAEAAYKKAWLEKEVLLHQVIQNEISWHERRQAVMSGAADVQIVAPTPTHAKTSGGDGNDGVAAVNGDDATPTSGVSNLREAAAASVTTQEMLD